MSWDIDLPVFGGYIGCHIGLQYSYYIVTTGDQIRDIEYINIDTSFTFIAHL